MNETVASEHRCGLCKRTFKQKSSLVRHAKRCTLEPTPSLRQKACKSCIAAKARCDLQRPSCARCSARGISCTYARPAKTRVGQEQRAPGPASTTTTGPVLDPGSEPVDPQLGAEPDAPGIVDVDVDVNADTNDNLNVGAYLGCGSSFAIASLPVPAHGLGSSIFPPGEGLASAPGPEPVSLLSSGSVFDIAYPDSCNLSSVPHPHSHHSESSYTGSLNAPVDLDGGSPDVDTGLLMGSEATACQLTPEEINSFCVDPPPTTPGVNTQDIEPWIVALASKHLIPNSPDLVQQSAGTILRIFRSWPRMLAKGISLPPIIHLSQFRFDVEDGRCETIEMPKHIARCITLCKMWVGQAEDSWQIVQEAAKREAESILTKYHTYDAPTLLAAMQSLVMLIVILIFPSNRQGTLSVVPEHLFEAVQHMSNHVLSTGMLLHEEASHVRPPMRIWSHIESKRRTLLSMHFLHWGYCAYHGLRHFNCLRLGRMRAPGPKWLWQATDEEMWSNLYARWLAQWDGKEFIQAEFFLIEKGPVMDARVEMWLEDADELGIMIMSIVNASQRDLSTIKDAEDNIIG